MTTREEFEKHILNDCDCKFLVIKENSDEYANSLIQEQWETWQACDELNKARIAELEALLAIERDYHFHVIADIKSFRQECARLELENKTLREALESIREPMIMTTDDSQVDILVYDFKDNPYTIANKALSTQTSTEQEKI